MSRMGRILAGALMVVSLAQLAVSVPPASDASEGGSGKVGQGLHGYLKVVDTANAADVRDWAEQMCYKETLASLAELIGTSPNIDMVADEMTHGWPRDAQSIVRDVLSEKLE